MYKIIYTILHNVYKPYILLYIIYRSYSANEIFSKGKRLGKASIIRKK